MYQYSPWNLAKERRLDELHALNWKSQGRDKNNRLFCGARCRDGHDCRAKAVVHKKTDKPLNGRCRMHGGLSTGAKTDDGKERCRQAASRGMVEYWKKKKQLK